MKHSLGAAAVVALAVFLLTPSSAQAVDPNIVYGYSSFEQLGSGFRPASAFLPGLSIVYYPVGGTAGAPVPLSDNSTCGHATFVQGNKGTLDWMIVAVGCPSKAKQCKSPTVLDQGSKNWTLGVDGYVDIDLPPLTQDLLDQVPNKCCPALVAELTATDSKAIDELFFSCGTTSNEFTHTRSSR